MQIAGRNIAPEEPPYVIAELSGNHRGQIDYALKLIEAAKEAGADCVKFQFYTPDSITIDHDGPEFILKRGPWKGRKLYDLYREAHTPPEWFPRLFERARELGITPFSSVFDPSAVDILEGLGAPAYKISSFDLTDLPLIERVKQTGKPIILSTGMGTPDEIRDADDALGEDYSHLFLHCVSGYPTPVREAALGQMTKLATITAMDVGLSDHTLGIEVPIAAVAMGAIVIEKHLTLKRSDGGPDAAFSLEPSEFKQLCQGVRDIHAAIHSEAPPSQESSRILRKSLYVVEDLSAGSLVSEQSVRAIRPALGLPPKFFPLVLGRRVRRDLAYGSPLSWEDLEG
jgi:pseudaminic acid synthase